MSVKFKRIIGAVIYILIDLTMASSMLSLTANFDFSSTIAITAPQTKPPMWAK